MTTLKLIFIILTIVFGVAAVIAPVRLGQAVGFTLTNPRGVVELRVGWGGLYIFMGVGAWYLAVPAAFAMLGLAYGGMALARVLALPYMRGHLERIYILSFVFELVAAIVLIIPSV